MMQITQEEYQDQMKRHAPAPMTAYPHEQLINFVEENPYRTMVIIMLVIFIMADLGLYMTIQKLEHMNAVLDHVIVKLGDRP
jgi:hypothetical protein